METSTRSSERLSAHQQSHGKSENGPNTENEQESPQTAENPWMQKAVHASWNPKHIILGSEHDEPQRARTDSSRDDGYCNRALWATGIDRCLNCSGGCREDYHQRLHPNLA